MMRRLESVAQHRKCDKNASRTLRGDTRRIGLEVAALAVRFSGGADLEPSHSRSRVCCADTLGFRDAQNDYTTASHVRVRIVARTNAGQLIPAYDLRDVRESTLGEGESSVREGGVASPRRFAREFGVKRHRRRRHASHSTAPARSPHS